MRRTRAFCNSAFAFTAVSSANESESTCSFNRSISPEESLGGCSRARTLGPPRGVPLRARRVASGRDDKDGYPEGFIYVTVKRSKPNFNCCKDFVDREEL
jgi:hypothetical protein